MLAATSSDRITRVDKTIAINDDVDTAISRRKKRNRNMRSNMKSDNANTTEVKVGAVPREDKEGLENISVNKVDDITRQQTQYDNFHDERKDENTAQHTSSGCMETQPKKHTKKKKKNKRKRNAKTDDSEESLLTPFEATEAACPDPSIKEETTQIPSPEIPTSDGVSQNHDKGRTVKALMSYDQKFAELQRRAYWRSCWFCKAEGYDTKMCGRCELVRYCGKDCQLQDHGRHKHLCKLVHKFKTAISKVNPEFVKGLHMAGFRKQMSCSLGSIPDQTRYLILGGPILCVVVEIVNVIPDPMYWKVLVRDITNQTAEVTFTNTFKTFPMFWFNPFDVNVVMARTLKPGNFLLLMNNFWEFYGHKTADLVVQDLNLVGAVDMSAQR